jgi:hypothetical protein
VLAGNPSHRALAEAEREREKESPCERVAFPEASGSGGTCILGVTADGGGR